MSKKATRAVTVDKKVGDTLAKVSYERRTPMGSLASMLLRDAFRLLDAGAFPDPDNLTGEGMRNWERLDYVPATAPGRKPKEFNDSQTPNTPAA